MFYVCPVFRYERPQSGRYRQHTQFGIEVIGEADASIDCEVIEVGWRYLEAVGLSGLTLVINSIGDAECRPAYVELLKAHYSPHREEICEDCARRIDRNALRLLDCKNAQCQSFIEDAPASADNLCADCESHWEDLRRYLEETGIEYQIDHRLVRGLDYYTRTVFEISPPEEGRMVTIVGGGRYDGLIEQLGGRPTPGIGYGMGLERVIQNIQRQEVPRRRTIARASWSFIAETPPRQSEFASPRSSEETGSPPPSPRPEECAPRCATPPAAAPPTPSSSETTS